MGILLKDYYTKCLILFVMIFALCAMKCLCQDDAYTVPNLKLRFPRGATMGIFVALAIPLNLPHRDTYYSHFFEAIHVLPSNQTSFEYPPLIERDIDRKMIYKAFERRIQSNGYPGKSCLLRTICEISQYSIKEINGLLGDIVYIMFTPSATKNFGLSPEYTNAERKGRHQDCSVYNKDCSVSFVELISKIEDSLSD